MNIRLSNSSETALSDRRIRFAMLTVKPIHLERTLSFFRRYALIWINPTEIFFMPYTLSLDQFDEISSSCATDHEFTQTLFNQAFQWNAFRRQPCNVYLSLQCYLWKVPTYDTLDSTNWKKTTDFLNWRLYCLRISKAAHLNLDKIHRWYLRNEIIYSIIDPHHDHLGWQINKTE